MKIETQNYDNVTVIELHGDFVAEFIKPFQDATSSIVAAGTSSIVIDMTNMGFIDSPSLEQLLWLKGSCSQNNLQLKIAGLDENCTKIFEITRLDSRFDTYHEVSQAVRSFV
ncbi:MAG TPA: STAS domain-containing protein [Planctomycetes bacterium]|nr:STAS domain-containing protein [Planctomycetota bacterium]HIJ70559.1 STAS domain-containing protein [Planctomycetota bacterium]